jgi:arylsulfatase A-like enzyme
MARPNVIYVFADQWRGQATGYAGDPNVRTPHLDALEKESVNFHEAVSGCPVCAPYRGSLMTGQYPVNHGVFLNDVRLSTPSVKLAEVFASGGYDTAYIGQWHLDGSDRSAPIPPQRRLGFRHWQAFGCRHDYHHSPYYEGDSETPRYWEGYDAWAQTESAISYFSKRGTDQPFLLMLAWGPPHTHNIPAPEEFRSLYDPAALTLRPNVPASHDAMARKALAAYYSHCSALDHAVGRLQQAIRDAGLEENTIFVFTSDHGDMLGSQGEFNKQRPWDESIRVPFLLKYPGLKGWRPGRLDGRLDAPDVMPTLLGLCGLPIPETVEGTDFSPAIRRECTMENHDALISCPHPFGQWSPQQGGREYRGLRTHRYTYVRALDGPWYLYDNEADPWQMHNLADDPSHAELRAELDPRLQARLDRIGDPFLPGEAYVRKWGYSVGENGAVPYQG